METLIYIVIAGILVYRLYTVLGSRDGNESNRPGWRAGNPFATRQNDLPGANKPQPTKNQTVNKDDLLALPLTTPSKSPAHPFDLNPQQQVQPFSAAPAQESLAGALLAVQRADPGFDERAFIKGARTAFEMIIRAFAAADRTALKNLLTPKLFAAFENAISQREIQGERWEIKTLVIQDMDIVAAAMQGAQAQITVQCVSDQSKIIYDKNGAVIADPGRNVERMTDVWTFTRDTRSTNPNWQLAETRT